MRRSRLTKGRSCSRKERLLLERYGSVKFKCVKMNEHKSEPGIHVFNPNDTELMDAKHDAVNKGFSTIWVHTKKGRFLGDD